MGEIANEKRFYKNFLKTAQPIVNRIPLMNQRSYQTTFFTLKPLPSDVIYDEIEDFSYKAEWVIPPEEDPEKVIFYTHGGGYGMGDLISSRALIAPIAKKQEYEFFRLSIASLRNIPSLPPSMMQRKLMNMFLDKDIPPEILLPLENQQAEAWRFLIFLGLLQRERKLLSVL